MQWILMLGLAINDPEPVELARVATQEECEKAVMVFLLASQDAAQERGDGAAPDLYLHCEKG